MDFRKSSTNKGNIDKFNTNKGNIIYCIILILITACVVVYILNIIVANQIIFRFRNEGIDYDLFRQMNISQEVIEEVMEFDSSDGKFISDNVGENPNVNKEYDKFDILTLYMLVYNYDTLEFKNIREGNIDLLLRSLTYDDNFRQLKNYYFTIFRDIESFPVIQASDDELNVGFEDTWNAYRGYGGDRTHEGTDLMDKNNVPGELEIVNMADGVVEQKGWLEQGGYRLGIRSKNGAYFYYAHLDSYADNLDVGDTVEAGETIGYMGDTGYGEEGTRGQFDVHLHLGIYLDSQIGEISINPYPILKYMSIFFNHFVV